MPVVARVGGRAKIFGVGAFHLRLRLGPVTYPLPVPPDHSKGCLAAAKGEQEEALPQHIAHVQIKQHHKQGGCSKCALSAVTESH